MQDILKIRDTRPQWAFTLLVLSLLTFVCVARAHALDVGEIPEEANTPAVTAESPVSYYYGVKVPPPPEMHDEAGERRYQAYRARQRAKIDEHDRNLCIIAFAALVVVALAATCTLTYPRAIAKALLLLALCSTAHADGPCDRYAAQKAGSDKLLAEKGLLVSTAAAPDFFFVLQPGDSQSRYITEKQLRMPNVSGLTIRLRLAWLERPDGSYDVTFLNQCVQRCHNTGDCYTILVMGGESSQPWLPANLNRYKRAAFMLSSYASDPLCVGVHVGSGVSPPGVSEEQHWKPAMPRAAIDAAKSLINEWATYFPNQAKLFAIGLPDSKAMNEIINYGIARCPGKFLVKGNALKASPFALTFPQHQLVVGAGQRGALIGWECVGSTKEARFGGSFQQAYNNAKTMANAAGKSISYIALYQSDIPALGGLR